METRSLSLPAITVSEEVFIIDNSYIGKLKLIKATFSELFPVNWDQAITDYYEKNPKQYNFSFDDLPRLSLLQINEMIEREEQYNVSVHQFTTLVSEHHFDQRLSELTGIIPGCEMPLFQWFFHNNEIVPVQNPRFRIGMEQLNDLFRDQLLLDYPIAERVITQPYRPFYYRGERKYFGSSKPTAFRAKLEVLREMILVDWLKIEEAAALLDEICCFRSWNDAARENYMAICQHYGLDTFMIDITSDLKTALFFACCKWTEDGWMPLAGDEASADGILHIGSREIFDMEMAQGRSERMIILPIGHQPLMRCSSQYAFMGLSRDEGGIIDLYADKHFITYRFERDEALCCWIYNECEQGKKIYPEEDNKMIVSYFDQLKSSKEIPEDVVEKWCKSICPGIKEAELAGSEDAVRISLEKVGYRICSAGRRFLSDKQVKEIDRNVAKIIEKRKIDPTMRAQYSMGDIRKALKTGKLPDSYTD